jgi:putative transposase
MWEASPTPISASIMSTFTIQKGRSAELRTGRVSEDFACYSITKTVNFRRPVLATDDCASVLMNSWSFLRSKERIKLFAFCVMPDHFHLVLCLMPGEDISKVMGDTNKFTARELNKLIRRRGQFWQEGFHDHRCRDDRDLYDLCLYAEHNPVRNQLIGKAEEWPYSSAYHRNRIMLDSDWWR